MRLHSVDGGKLKNEIPREAEAIVLLKQSKIDGLKKLVEEYQTIFKEEYNAVASELSLIALQMEEHSMRAMSIDLQRRLVNSIIACPHGAL